MKQKGFSNIILIVLVIVLSGVVVYFALLKPEPITQSSKNQLIPTQAEHPVTERVASSQVTSAAQTSNLFPPHGWYVHVWSVDGWDRFDYKILPVLETSVMLTRLKTFPVGYCENTEGGCYGEQIHFIASTTALTPEEYISQILHGGTYPSTQKWGTLNGHKIFSMIYTTDADTTPAEQRFIFTGNKVYKFLLSPSIEKNFNDFQQVVGYYTKNF
mgnify:CR=1 FL=1